MVEGGLVRVVTVRVEETIANVDVAILTLCSVIVVWRVDGSTVLGDTEGRLVWNVEPLGLHVGLEVSHVVGFGVDHGWIGKAWWW